MEQSTYRTLLSAVGLFLEKDILPEDVQKSALQDALQHLESFAEIFVDQEVLLQHHELIVRTLSICALSTKDPIAHDAAVTCLQSLMKASEDLQRKYHTYILDVPELTDEVGGEVSAWDLETLRSRSKMQRRKCFVKDQLTKYRKLFSQIKEKNSMQCTQCGSRAINHHLHGRDGSDPDLCDVCYWRKRSTKQDALPYRELQCVARAALEYIDALPEDLVLQAMPGFDRDWADSTLKRDPDFCNARHWKEQAAPPKEPVSQEDCEVFATWILRGQCLLPREVLFLVMVGIQAGTPFQEAVRHAASEWDLVPPEFGEKKN